MEESTEDIPQVKEEEDGEWRQEVQWFKLNGRVHVSIFILS
jgi:hypothetical protein